MDNGIAKVTPVFAKLRKLSKKTVFAIYLQVLVTRSQLEQVNKQIRRVFKGFSLQK